jgi:hypothetical protein
MPVLHKYVDGSGYYILTSINGHVISFQLTAAGYKKLKEAGIGPGHKFSRFLLLDLYRDGHAYTHGSGLSGPEVIPGQGIIEFPPEPETEKLLPSCSNCSSLKDLHLAEIINKGNSVKILCSECRASNRASIDSSIPLSMLARSSLKNFLSMRQFDIIDPTVVAYQKLLNMEFEDKWVKVKKKKKPVQGSLLEKKRGDSLL